MESAGKLSKQTQEFFEKQLSDTISSQEVGIHVSETPEKNEVLKKNKITPNPLNNTLSAASSSDVIIDERQTISKLSNIQDPDTSPETSPRFSMDQALKSEKAFIEYVMSLPTAPASSKYTPHHPEIEDSPSKTKYKDSSSILTTSNANKVGLDHLNNLCKLMEQLSELRETNSKLQKRVQYLEDLKTLHEMHKEMSREVQYGSENILSQRKQRMILQMCPANSENQRCSTRGSEGHVQCSSREGTDFFSHIPNCRSPSERRSRVANNPQFEGHRRERSKSVGHEETYDSKSKRIFPKWSKVKEALGWESEKKEPVKSSRFHIDPTGIVNEEPHASEDQRIFTDNDIVGMRLPLYSEYNEKDDTCLTDSYAGEAMATCGEGNIIPYNSSAEDISGLVDGFLVGLRRSKRHSGSSDKRFSLLDPSTENIRRLKSTPSPGSEKVKLSQETLELKPKSLTIERDINAVQAFAKFEKEDSKKSHKSPWGRVKTIIEKRRDSLKRRAMRRVPVSESHITPSNRSHFGNMCDVEDSSDNASSYDYRRKSSDEQFFLNSSLSNVEYGYDDEPQKSYKRKKQVTTDQGKEVVQEQPRKVPPPPIKMNLTEHPDTIENRTNSQNPDREVGFRTPDSSPQFHRKSTWMKMKNALRSKKEGDSAQVSSSQSMPSSPNGTHDSHFEFEDIETLGETSGETDCYNGGHEITRVGSDSFVHKLSSTSAPVSDIMLELQRNISEDFTRKMQEWERIRNSRIRPPTSPKWERKNSGSKSRKKNEKSKTERYEKSPKPKIKDITWLEKELQKIEKEKQRLSREKEKYEERAIRLERLRQTVLTAQNSNKKEVLVRTSAGEFRFEGISDAFTKKLYEWETKRGLGPELSTIALLDSSLGPNKNCLTIQQVEKGGTLHRGLSRSESSIAEIGQHSHTSSNSLPSLKPTECSDLERINQHSRANSEPDLSSYGNKPNSSQSRLPNQNYSGIECSPAMQSTNSRDSYAHPEVTQLIDSDIDEVMCDSEECRQEQRDDNYYGLLEENVILLERLKDKEEICEKLENDLEKLDEKVEEMNTHHQQEVERYRRKLWEMHKPGNTPREVQGCLEVMGELRSRIENLEKYSEKLKTEKENLEDSFRFHSAEQENMTLDLLDKMRELQAAGTEPQKGKKVNNHKEIQQPNFDIKIVERLQDLSSQLVKQTRELEQALAERTQQICQLRWELLHKDVSTVKLETELHSVQMQRNTTQNRSKCEDKRSKYAHFRSWSSEEAPTRISKECKATDHSRPSVLQETYCKQPKTEFQASKLTSTVHELNRELIRLSSAAESLLGGQKNTQEDWMRTAENECVVHSRVPKLQKSAEVRDYTLPSSSEASSCDTSLIQKKESRVPKISVRRNSVGSISMTSGMEPSESSSINDEGTKLFPILKSSPKLHQRMQSSTSSDTESTTEEEIFVRGITCPNATSTAAQEIILRYPSMKKIKKNNYEKIKETEDNYADNRESRYQPSGLKKRLSNKTVKTNRKLNNRSGQGQPSDETLQKYPISKQSESDTAINNRLLTPSIEGKTCCDVNAQKHIISNLIALRSCQSADQVTSNQLKSENAGKISRSITERIFAIACTGQNDKIEHVSKITPYHRSNIRKSESLTNPIKKTFDLQEAKRSKSMKMPKEVQFPQKIQDVDKNRSSSFRKRTTRTGKSKDQSKISSNINKRLEVHIQSSNSDSTRSPKGAIRSNFLNRKEEASIKQTMLADRTKAINTLTANVKLDFPVADQSSHLLLEEELCLTEKNADISGEKVIPKNCQRSNFRDDNIGCINISTNKSEPKEIFSSAVSRKLPKKKSKASDTNISSWQTAQQEINSQPANDSFIISNETTTEFSAKRRFTKCTQKENNSSTGQIATDCKTDENNPVLNKVNTSPMKPDIHRNKYCSEELKSSYVKGIAHDTMPSVMKNSIKSNDSIKQSSNKSLKFPEINPKNLKLQELAPINTPSPTEKNTQMLHDESEKVNNCANNVIHSNKEEHSSFKHNEGQHIRKEPSPEENKNVQNNYCKSPSAPQLDWKKVCAKKTSREGAPNVKTLIERYNKKILENQSSTCANSSNYNSPATVRKISAPPESNKSEIKNIPRTFSSTPNSPRIISSSTFYNPLTFKPANLDIFRSPITTPPTSPSLRARAIALQKAKEKFISSTNIASNVPEVFSLSNTTEQKGAKTSFFPLTPSNPTDLKTLNNEAKRSATDSSINVQTCQTEQLGNFYGISDRRKSACSNKSMDSMSMVLYKTGETCQESRLLKRCEKQKPTNFQAPTEGTKEPSKSLSNSSIFKTVTGHDIKFPTSFLRLRRSHRKKDIASASQLCRQSLLVSGESSSFQADEPSVSKSPRSCPSSPELKSKSKVKQSWLQRNIFRRV